MGILFVLIGAFCFAISNAYWKKVTQTIPYQIGMFFRGVFAAGVFAVLYFGFRESAFFTGWTVRPLALDQQFFFTLLICVFNIFGLMFFLRGIQKAPICINISSPNTENLRNFHEQENLKKLLSEILNIKKTLNSKTPVVLKISPDINDEDIDVICKNILEFNLDGLVLTNTSVKLRENLVNKQKNEIGGVSGTPIKDTSNLIIKKFFKTLKAKVPIIGVGGINSGISAYEKIRAGASLLQLYTGLVYKGPFVVRAIKQELAELLRRDGFSSLQKAVGVDSE